jgi:hypothetical protein
MLAWNRKQLSHILSLGAALHALLSAAVMRAAERLPVRLVPEQPLVAAVRHDVIDYGRPHRPAGTQAHHAEGVLLQKRRTRLIPASAVAALAERAAAPVMLTVALRSRSRVRRSVWRRSLWHVASPSVQITGAGWAGQCQV